MVGVRDSLEEALPGENSRNAHQAGQNGHGSHHVAGLGDFVKAGVLFTAGGTAAGSAGHLVTAGVTLTVVVVVIMGCCPHGFLALRTDGLMGVVVKVFPDDISKMAGGAAGIAFAVTVRIRTEGSIIAAGVCAIVRAGQEMMFSVCFESALVADAVVHTNMLTVVNNGITIFAEKMVIVVIITPDCMFMAAIKFVKAAEIAYVPNSVMGFYVTEIGKTVRAVFDMAFTSGRGVGYVFMRAFRIRLRSAAHGAVMRAVISVRFVSRDCFVAVVAVFGMRLVIDYPAGVLMLAGCGSIGILGVAGVLGVTGVLRILG